MKKILSILTPSLLAFVLLVGLAAPVLAHQGRDDTDQTQEVDDSQDDGDSNDSENENESENETETETETHHSRTEREGEYRQKLAERKTELKERFTQLKEERHAKFEGRRLEICNKREDQINSILSAGVERSKRNLAVFQKIAEKVEAFYASKGVTADGYDAAVATVTAKEAAAVAAIEATSSVTFDCNNTDAKHPGQTIKEALKVRHTALKQYRDAIKDLIDVVKKALDAENTATDDQNKEEN